jgi:hypothetical protein
MCLKTCGLPRLLSLLIWHLVKQAKDSYINKERYEITTKTTILINILVEELQVAQPLKEDN